MERLRSNWLFAGSLRGGQRAAAVMSLIQSAKLNRHDPYAYLKVSAPSPTSLPWLTECERRKIYTVG